MGIIVRAKNLGTRRASKDLSASCMNLYIMPFLMNLCLTDGMYNVIGLSFLNLLCHVSWCAEHLWHVFL